MFLKSFLTFILCMFITVSLAGSGVGIGFAFGSLIVALATNMELRQHKQLRFFTGLAVFMYLLWLLIAIFFIISLLLP